MCRRFRDRVHVGGLGIGCVGGLGIGYVGGLGVGCVDVAIW